VCVCVRACMYLCACVCVCVCNRIIGNDKKTSEVLEETCPRIGRLIIKAKQDAKYIGISNTKSTPGGSVK